MLKKKNRLNKQREFDRVFQNGSSSFDRFIGVKAAKNNLENNRFGVIVSNKVSKKAVERNRIKRILREIIKDYREETRPGLDIVVIALPPSRERTFSQLKDSYYKHLKKLKFLG